MQGRLRLPMADAAWPLLVLCWPPATATAIDPRLWLRGTLVRVQVRRLHGLAVAERRPAGGRSGSVAGGDDGLGRKALVEGITSPVTATRPSCGAAGGWRPVAEVIDTQSTPGSSTRLAWDARTPDGSG